MKISEDKLAAPRITGGTISLKYKKIEQEGIFSPAVITLNEMKEYDKLIEFLGGKKIGTKNN